ncbi:toll/interleukin-1 receptor domain-containing protein [Mesorhizobium sp. BR-1-1-10]|uniref:toll/interleukin-1 receptor domain-containing protein n=1 Tax=Mesorhizobium sp. BR-1-1-10 TaxID=2876660 RepID=UPI001CD14380|nr:toll/interleukin-1 receptor domain-containing protein [Mesorhizobium sp. BR-1-1-10]MBZ9975465.1 toll/interleukin-1 receptor domain-containing protein [Mesorhizobium sp. BR-1-1-10]
MNAAINKDVFLSHSSADNDLVEAFETLLTQALGITSAQIFCSSLEGQGVPKGANFVDGIKAKVLAAKAVVALISPAYLDSAFCMAELGAAWALSTQRYPVVVPPNDFSVMNATLLGVVGVSLDNENALLQMLEELCTSLGVPQPPAVIKTRALRTFQRSWADLSKKIKGPARIEAAVHADALKSAADAIEARDAAEELLAKAEVRIKALEKLKDADEVAKLRAQLDDSGWEEQFDEAIGKIRNLRPDLGGREIQRLLILDYLGKPSWPDMHNYSDEVARAEELDVYDQSSKVWNHDNPDVKELLRLVEHIQSIFAENDAAGKTMKERGEKSDPDSIRFWESHLR